MALRIVWEFYCPLCGYVKRLNEGEELTVCPACQNGKGQAWTDKPKDDAMLTKEEKQDGLPPIL